MTYSHQIIRYIRSSQAKTTGRNNSDAQLRDTEAQADRNMSQSSSTSSDPSSSSLPAKALRTPPRKKNSANGSNKNSDKRPKGSSSASRKNQGSKGTNKTETTHEESKSARRRRKKREAAQRRKREGKAAGRENGPDSPQKKSTPNRRRSPNKQKKQDAQRGHKKEKKIQGAQEGKDSVAQSRETNIEKAKSAANEEQKRRITDASKSQIQEEMMRAANVKQAYRAVDAEQQRRIEESKRVQVHEQLTRERNLKEAHQSIERERERRMSEDKRVATLEHMLRVSNQALAKREMEEERDRRIKEDSAAEERVRRRSLSLENGIVAGAAALQSGSPLSRKLSSKQSWKAPKTPRTNAAENLRERRLSMQGFPSLASTSNIEKTDSITQSNQKDPDAKDENGVSSTVNETSDAERNATEPAIGTVSDDNDVSIALNSASHARSEPRENSSANDKAAQNLSDFNEFKVLQKSANAAKAQSDFKKALDLYGSAIEKIRSMPAEYHQERAEVLKRSAICFIAEKRYEEALESVRTAHREVTQMINGAPTTELLRWNLTYQMVRGLQKQCKFSRSSKLATSLISQIKLRIEKAEKDGKAWSESEVKKAKALSAALKKATSQNTALAAKNKKPQGQYFDSKGSGFGKSGLFSDTKPKSVIDNAGMKSSGSVVSRKMTSSTGKDAPEETNSETKSQRTNVVNEKKQEQNNGGTDNPDEDDDSFWLWTAGAAILVAGIAVFSIMRGR